MAYYISLDELSLGFDKKTIELTIKPKNNVTTYAIKKEPIPQSVPNYEGTPSIKTTGVKFVKGVPSAATTLICVHCWNPQKPIRLFISSLKYKKDKDSVKVKNNTPDVKTTSQSADLVLRVDDPEFATKLKKLQILFDAKIQEMRTVCPKMKTGVSKFIYDFKPEPSTEYPDPKLGTYVNTRIDFGKWSDKHFIESLRGKPKSKLLEKVGDSGIVPLLINGLEPTLESFIGEFKKYKIIGATFYDFKFTEYKSSLSLAVKSLVSTLIIEKIVISDGDGIEISQPEAPKVDLSELDNAESGDAELDNGGDGIDYSEDVNV